MFSQWCLSAARSDNDSNQAQMSASDRAVWPQEMPLCHPLFHFPFCMGTLVGYRLLLWEWKQSNGFNYFQCSLLIFSLTHTSSRAHSKVELSGHDDRREIRHIHTSPKPIISWFLFQSQLLVAKVPWVMGSYSSRNWISLLCTQVTTTPTLHFLI